MRPLKLIFALCSAAGMAAAALAALTPMDGCVLPDFTLDAGGAEMDHTPPPPPATCGATYPDPPGGPDQGPDAGTIVLAIHTIELGDDNPSAPPPGYDLDHTCTCFDGGGPTCVGRSPSPMTYCDAQNGIDDQTLQLVTLIQTALGAGSFGSAFFTAGAEQGKWTMLIEITGYNGAANDPVVQVALYPSPGFVAGASPNPNWDGTDVWRISSESLVPGDGGPDEIPVGDGGLVARFQADGAYVAGGTLVATIPSSQLVFVGGSNSIFQLKLSDGVLTGELSQRVTSQGKVWTLKNGILAARWALGDLFDDLASYRDENGMPLCKTMAGYNVAKAAICNEADILVDPNAPKSMACDALSFGLGFTADTANLGAVVDAGAMSDSGCADGESPAGDFCPPP